MEKYEDLEFKVEKLSGTFNGMYRFRIKYQNDLAQWFVINEKEYEFMLKEMIKAKNSGKNNKIKNTLILNDIGDGDKSIFNWFSSILKERKLIQITQTLYDYQEGETTIEFKIEGE